TQFYQAQGSASPIKVTMHEHDLRQRDVQLFEYSVIPTLLLLTMISSLVNGGLATAREWETRTVKELLLSPGARGAIIDGNFLAGGIGLLAFEPDWLQNIAAFIPLSYGRHALEMAVFYSSSDQFALDMAILALTALVTLSLGTLSMRRSIAS